MNKENFKKGGSYQTPAVTMTDVIIEGVLCASPTGGAGVLGDNSWGEIDFGEN